MLLLSLLVAVPPQMPARAGHAGGEVIIVVADPCGDAAAEIVELLRRTLSSHESVRVIRLLPQSLCSVRRSDVPVHSIYLTCRTRGGGFLRRIGRTVAVVALWLTEALIDEDQQLHASDDIARKLKRISIDTGGEMCVASDRRVAQHCADTISTRISGSAVNRQSKRRTVCRCSATAAATAEARRSAPLPGIQVDTRCDRLACGDQVAWPSKCFLQGQGR